MTIDNKIRDEKFLFGKIDKNEYLTGEEMLHPDQRKVIEQATIIHKICDTNSSFHVK